MNQKQRWSRTRIADVEDVAEALFNEWELELTQFSNERLRLASKRKLVDTKRRYQKMDFCDEESGGTHQSSLGGL